MWPVFAALLVLIPPAVEAEEIRSLVLRVAGMTCEQGCAAEVRETLQTIEGVLAVKVDFARRRAEVAYDPARTDAQKILVEFRQRSEYPARLEP